MSRYAGSALFFTLVLLQSCAARPRILSEEERLRHGLTGIAYDLPLCPMDYDARTGDSKVKGACERVSCEMENKRLVCRARPEGR